MSTPKLRLRGPETARLTGVYRKPLGQALVDTGALTPEMLLGALAIVEQCKAPLAQVCLSEGLVSEADILRAQAERFAAIPLSLVASPPDESVAQLLDPIFCLEHGVFPWMKLGDTLVVATATPERFDMMAELLPAGLDDVIMGVAAASEIEEAIGRSHGAELARRAEVDVPDELSCRNLHVVASPRQMAIAAGCAALLGALILWNPNLFFVAAAGWAVLTLVLVAAMKLSALVAGLTAKLRSAVPRAGRFTGPWPKVTLLVPLFHETDIAGALVERLGRLTYPKSRLDVLLVLEAEDSQTRATLRRTRLPPWMRVITVPPGELTTKPRALNYARRFSDGDIVGVYDAEDSPAPDQIEVVARRFRDSPAEVGCLQGILDYYNPRMNWLARCFTIEYAAWFRILLPGLARLGFAIPLGGTTVFFRREVLDEMHGWDAHNVTEDADLGMRLARAGYRTELIDTVTLEEANCRFWPWVRQRSRWLKGYMATYLVHMRNPLRLLRELGPWRFMGFQVFFLASLSQFVLAPILWSFWIVLFGLPHPLIDALPQGGFLALASLFVVTEVIGLLVGMTAVASPRHRHLLPFVPTLMFYFPLGAIAAYKALIELITRPFYWDKTNHGLSVGKSVIDH